MLKSILLAGVLSVSTGIGISFADGLPKKIDGAELGSWTMDYESAKALAKEKNLPMFLNFTGSDWCGWCKLMDKSVFSSPEWAKFAGSEILAVWIDFPSDKDLVPEKWRSQNNKLSSEFGVRGYPTYIILSPDGKNLGQLGASRNAKPQKFIDEVRGLVGTINIQSLLSAEDFELWNALSKKTEELQQKMEAVATRFKEEMTKLQKETQDNLTKIDELRQKANTARKSAADKKATKK